MTIFIGAAALLTLLAAAFLVVPVMRRQGAARTPALIGAIVLVALALMLYLTLGNFQWTRGSAAQGQNQSIATLARHLETDPKDIGGWLAIAQQYTAIGQYSLAVRSYERVNALSDNSNATALAGMAEAMTLSGDEAQAAKAQELFEHVLQLDPTAPKALFYTGIAALQAGRLQLARERFQKMLELQPPQNVQAALRKQIATIDEKLSATVDPRTAIHVRVTLAPEITAQIPPDASLFVFVQAPQGGAPLAVKRLSATLPQDVTLSAADAMLAGHGVQAGQKVTVLARISASGNPLASQGDLSGQIRYVAGKDSARELRIDHRQ